MLFVALLGLAGLYSYLTSSRHIRAVTIAALEQSFGGRAEVEDAQFHLNGPVILTAVELDVPGLPPQAGRILFVDRIVIQHDPWAILWGQFRPTHVRLEGFHVYLTENLATGRYTLQQLLEHQPSRPGQVPKRLPPIDLANGRLVVGTWDGSQYRLRGSLGASGQVQGDTHQAGLYHFAFQQIPAAPETATTRPSLLNLTGWFSLADRSLSASLHGLTFHNAATDLLPTRWQAWWNRLEPSGSVPQLDVWYVPPAIHRSSTAPEVATGWEGRMTLRNFAVTAPQTRRGVRLTVRHARVGFHNGEIGIEALSGRAFDVDYRITGQIHGLNEDAPFDLTVDAQGPIPHDPQVIDLLPHGPAFQIRRFHLRGGFAVHATISRGPGQPHPVAIGRLTLRQVTASDAYHPYPVHDLLGTIDFDSKQAQTNLTALGPTGARITITGWVSPPEDGKAHYVVTAKDVPIDQYMMGTVPAQVQQVIEAFVSQGAWRRLIEQGLVRAPGQEAGSTTRPTPAGAAATQPATAPANGMEAGHAPLPLFEPGGTVNLTILNDRPPGPKQPWSMQVQIEAADTHVLTAFWPYPFTVTGGRIDADPQSVVVKHVELCGLAGGRGTVSGTVRRSDQPPHSWVPNLRMDFHALPLDAILMQSLPADPSRWLQALHPHGVFDAQGTVAMDAHGRPDFQVAVTVKDASARPFGGRFQIEDLAGRVAFTRQGLQELHMTARHGTSPLTLTGQAHWTPQGAVADLQIAARKVLVDDTLADLVPADVPSLAQVRQTLQDYHPAGEVDADLVAKLAPQTPADYRLVLQPRTLAFTWHSQRLDFQELSGQVILSPGLLNLSKLSARIGSTHLSMNGQVKLGAQPSTSLTFSAEGEQLDAGLLALLPEDLSQSLRRIDLRGAYRIDQAHLEYAATPAGPRMKLTAHMTLQDASAMLGVPISAFHGTIDLTATRGPGDKYAHLTLNTHATRVRIVGRLVRQLTVDLASKGDSDALEIRRFDGLCYGGQVQASGQVQPGAQGRYRLQLSLTDAALDPLVHPDRDQPWEGPTTNPTTRPAGATTRPAEAPGAPAPTGVVTASLSLEGSTLNATDRHGRGDLRIRNARLYEVPLTLAVLQIINLSWPSSTAFDSASARYLIDGDTVRFDRISFDAPGVQIAGTGTMTYSTLALNLNLYSHNPRPLLPGPLGDALSMVKNELLSIHVGGTLTHPQATLRSLPGLQRSWEEIFNGK